VPPSSSLLLVWHQSGHPNSDGGGIAKRKPNNEDGNTGHFGPDKGKGAVRAKSRGA